MIHTEYRHGGDVFGAARSMRCNPREIYDFSANINPLGTSPMALAAIADNLDLIRHYPDPRCAELRAALAGYLNVAPEKMVLGNGAAELIYLLARVMNFRRAVVTAPTFVEYGAAITNAGGHCSKCLCWRRRDLRCRCPVLKRHCAVPMWYIFVILTIPLVERLKGRLSNQLLSMPGPMMPL